MQNAWLKLVGIVGVVVVGVLVVLEVQKRLPLNVPGGETTASTEEGDSTPAPFLEPDTEMFAGTSESEFERFQNSGSGLEGLSEPAADSLSSPALTEGDLAPEGNPFAPDDATSAGAGSGIQTASYGGFDPNSSSEMSAANGDEDFFGADPSPGSTDSGLILQTAFSEEPGGRGAGAASVAEEDPVIPLFGDNPAFDRESPADSAREAATASPFADGLDFGQDLPEERVAPPEQQDALASPFSSDPLPVASEAASTEDPFGVNDTFDSDTSEQDTDPLFPPLDIGGGTDSANSEPASPFYAEENPETRAVPSVDNNEPVRLPPAESTLGSGLSSSDTEVSPLFGDDLSGSRAGGAQEDEDPFLSIPAPDSPTTGQDNDPFTEDVPSDGRSGGNDSLQGTRSNEGRPFSTDQPIVPVSDVRDSRPSETPSIAVEPPGRFDNLDPIAPSRLNPEGAQEFPPLPADRRSDDRDLFGDAPGRGVPGDTRPSVPAASASGPAILKPHVTLRKIAPSTATVGEPTQYRIEVRNEGMSPALNVLIEDELPATVQLIEAVPTPDWDKTTRRMIWSIPELPAGDSQVFTVRVSPVAEGRLDGIATVRFEASIRSSTVITSPRLTVEVRGPKAARIGDRISLAYRVANDGTGDARNVVVRSVLPPGLEHSEGRDLEYEIPELRAGEERRVSLTVVAVDDDLQAVQAEVWHGERVAAQSEARVDVVGAQLNVMRRGPAKRYVGRSARFENIVSNETAFEANNARLVEYIPAGMKYINSSSSGVYNASERTVSWEVPSLPPGQQVSFEVEVMAESGGELESRVEVIENAGYSSQTVGRTVVEDIHNVSADISRLSGPVGVGERFGFEIEVDNRGTAPATNVVLQVEVPKEVKIEAAGDRNLQAGLKAGTTNVIEFRSIPRIASGDTQKFRITLRGQTPVRNAQIRARVQCDGMESPLLISESVTVIEEF